MRPTPQPTIRPSGSAPYRGAVGVLVDKLPYVTLLLRVRGNSDVERATLERRRAFDHRVTALVVEAQRAGQVRTDVDGAVATRLLFGMVNSIVEWYRPAGPVDRERLAQDVVTVVLDGMRPADRGASTSLRNTGASRNTRRRGIRHRHAAVTHPTFATNGRRMPRPRACTGAQGAASAGAEVRPSPSRRSG